MSIPLGLSFAFVLLCMVVLGIAASKMWRGDATTTRALELAISIVPFQSDVKRGMVRGIVPFLLSVVFAVITVGLMVTAVKTWSGGSKFTPWTLAVCGALAVMILSYGLHLCVVFLSKPRLLIPPHLRNDPGVFAGRRGVSDDVAEAYAAEADQLARHVSRQRR